MEAVSLLGDIVERPLPLAKLRELLAVAPTIALVGPSGSGKSVLVRALAAALPGQVSVVDCLPDDTEASARARAERTLRCLPGGLTEMLANSARVLVFDQAHELSTGERTRLLNGLIAGPTALGRVLVVIDEALPLSRGGTTEQAAVTGLDESEARALWRALRSEVALDDDGRARVAAAFDGAFARSGGLPRALHREFAISVYEAAAEISSLPKAERDLLEFSCVVRMPMSNAEFAAAHALLAKLSTEANDAALSDTVDINDFVDHMRSLALLDSNGAALSMVPTPIRREILAAMSTARRQQLESAAATLLSNSVSSAPRASIDGNTTTFVLDSVDRLREVVRHHLAANELDRASAFVVEHRDVALMRGAHHEIDAILSTVGPGHPEIHAIRVELALRGGRIAEAVELSTRLAGKLPASVAIALATALGDHEQLATQLTKLRIGSEPELLAAVVVGVVELSLDRGDVAVAEAALAMFSTPSSVAKISAVARARLHMAQASVDLYGGSVAAATAALARARAVVELGARDLAAMELGVRIDARRAGCLVLEGRVSEATDVLIAATSRGAEIDAVSVSAELEREAIHLLTRRGELGLASSKLSDVVMNHRARGDERGALSAEVELAEVLLQRGEVTRASERASAVSVAAGRRHLGHLSARAALVHVAIELSDLRLDAVRVSLANIAASPALLDANSIGRATVLAAEYEALVDRKVAAIARARAAGGPEVRDEIDRMLSAAVVAVAAGDLTAALELARDVAAQAERAGRIAELAHALALVARLALARGDRGGARSAATRAVREATTAGLLRTRVQALLALAALARDEGRPEAAVDYARDAVELANEAGLPVERLVAYAALDGLAGGDVLADPSLPSAATMTPAAVEAAARMLADLGLTALRPFRVIDADGGSSDVTDANPEILRLASRSLAVDGVRESIWRNGEELADLRRRSLLKRLLFLFAAAPGKNFSKEEIVHAVWNVEYHPLRHDSALFTNIMRIRRLLGEDGAEIIRVTDDGYRFVPPRDYVFVQPS